MALVVKKARKGKKVVSCGGCGKDTQNGSGFCDSCNAPDIFDDPNQENDGTGWAAVAESEENNEDEEYPDM